MISAGRSCLFCCPARCEKPPRAMLGSFLGAIIGGSSDMSATATCRLVAMMTELIRCTSITKPEPDAIGLPSILRMMKTVASLSRLMISRGIHCAGSIGADGMCRGVDVAVATGAAAAGVVADWRRRDSADSAGCRRLAAQPRRCRAFPFPRISTAIRSPKSKSTATLPTPMTTKSMGDLPEPGPWAAWPLAGAAAQRPACSGVLIGRQAARRLRDRHKRRSGAPRRAAGQRRSPVSSW